MVHRNSRWFVCPKASVEDKVMDASIFKLSDGTWRLWYNNEQPTRILEEPGKSTDDQSIGGHGDVVVNDNKPHGFYFTHPGRRKDKPAAKNSFEDKRSVIQLGELHYVNGEITCDKDEPVYIHLKK